LGKGGKILLGCGIAAVLAAGVAAVAVVGGAFWLKGKAEKFTGDVAAKAQDITRYEQQANQNSFTEPADGVLEEERLVKFLDVRKQVFVIYEAHKVEIEDLSRRTEGKKDLSLSETLEAASLMGRLVSDIRLAQVKGMAGNGMSEPEYRYIAQAVYKSAWAGMYEKGQGDGQQPADALQKAADETVLTMPGGEAMAQQMRQQAEALRVPEANVRLFKKYEADIVKYAMSGLAGIGL
jgi:hypothetical protein